MEGQATIHINATPDTVFALVSDVTRMGEWSPETIHCEWVEGATGPAVGAKFKGTNKLGFYKWSTTPTITELSPRQGVRLRRRRDRSGATRSPRPTAARR